jgi:DNA-binding PadR family transcriptional regulator
MSSPQTLPMNMGIKGFLRIVLIHELSKEPQSGYQLIASIEKKTGGAWIPSKGAIYPALKNLEEEGLIRVSSTGVRYKRIYSLTKKGRKFFSELRKQQRCMSKVFSIAKGLILEHVAEDEGEASMLTMGVRAAVMELEEGQENKAVDILADCLKKLQNLPRKPVGPLKWKL